MTPLFVCSQGKIRSRTAEVLCALGGMPARSCGTDADAIVPINDVLVRGADAIFCMEAPHKRAVLAMAHGDPARTFQLGLRDIYSPYETLLIDHLILATEGLDPRVAEALRRGREAAIRLDLLPRTKHFDP